MQAHTRRRTWWFAATAMAIGLVVIAVVVGILISSHVTTNSSGDGRGGSAAPTGIGSAASATAENSPSHNAASPTSTSGSEATARRSATPAQGRPQATGSTTTGRSATTTNSAAPVLVCASADFDPKTNACVRADPTVSAGNGGLTVDGDVSFPDYMTGMITLLQKQGASWRRLGEFSTKTYPDVVVIDSHAHLSVQLANVFAYGGHRALPACSSTWGIEVDDGQGLPLGDAMFVYTCK